MKFNYLHNIICLGLLSLHKVLLSNTQAIYLHQESPNPQRTTKGTPSPIPWELLSVNEDQEYFGGVYLGYDMQWITLKLDIGYPVFNIYLYIYIYI